MDLLRYVTDEQRCIAKSFKLSIPDLDVLFDAIPKESLSKVSLRVQRNGHTEHQQRSFEFVVSLPDAINEIKRLEKLRPISKEAKAFCAEFDRQPAEQVV